LPGAPGTTAWLGHIALAATGVALMALVVARLGRSSMEAWLVGGLVSGALGALARALTSASHADRLAYVLGAVLALSVAVMVTMRRGVARAMAKPH